jgi:hypothetical protein
MNLEEKVDLLMKQVEVLREDLSCLQLQIDLISDRVYDYTSEYDIEL